MKTRWSKRKSQPSSSCFLCASYQTWLSGEMMRLCTGTVSPLSPSSSLCLFSLSASLNWGQGSLGPILLCWRKIANLGYSGSKSFIKELICYSLPFTHSPFSHTLPFFHWLSVPRSDFLSCSFLWLFMLCSPPRPLITKPIPNTVG